MRIITTICCLAAITALGCNTRDGDDSGTPTDVGMCVMMGPENTAAACADGADNECDGNVDCNDFDCCSVVTCGADTACGRRDGGGGTCTPVSPALPAEGVSAAACADGVDNDMNCFTDCRDFACTEFCGVENSNPACIDGIDNNMNGFVDCDDRDCEERIVCAGEETNANCIDGLDNDGDGDTDCDDSDCVDEAIVVCDSTGPTGIPEAMWAAMITTRCTDGDDNDGDSRFDCGEFGCLWNYPGCDVQPPPERDNASCSDGDDNDLDGFEDCDDTDCQQEGIVVCNGTMPVMPLIPAAMYEALSNTECSNGDNEDAALEGGSTFVDCADFSCQGNPDVTICTMLEMSESNPAACSDGIDNDMDGRIDCMDFDCTTNRYVTNCESGFEKCTNGDDDNGNGRFDCDDFECTPLFGPLQPACL